MSVLGLSGSAWDLALFLYSCGVQAPENTDSGAAQ